MHLSSRRRLLVTIVAVLFAAGCAASSAAPRSGSQHNVITNAELLRAGDVSLHDALSQLRPAFLRPRAVAGPQNTPAQLQVYVGQLQMEGVVHLREIMAKNVKEVRFLEPQQANARYGGNNSGGALVITML
jgi:hypothetical protein